MKKLMFLSILCVVTGSAYADKRFYLCDIIGDGGESNPFRTAAFDLGVAYTALIPSDLTTGRPLFTWALTRVAAPNHSEMVRVCDPLPDFPMDGKVSGINQATKVLMKNRVKARMGGTAAWIDNTDGYREVIRTVGKHLEPAFNEDNFDVEE